MLAELLPKGRGKLVESQQAAGSPQGCHKELAYPGAWVSSGVLSSLSSGVRWYQTQLQTLFIFLHTDKSENNLISQTPIPHWILGSGICEICGKDSNLVQLMAPGEAETPLEMYMKHHNLIHSSVSFQNQHSFELCGNLKLINNCPCSNSCVSQSQLKMNLQ